MTTDPKPLDAEKLWEEWYMPDTAAGVSWDVLKMFYALARDKEIEIRALRSQTSMEASAAPGPYGYAVRLATSLARKHWPEITGWKPLGDLMGVLSQLDNMTAGMVRAPDAPEIQEGAKGTEDYPQAAFARGVRHGLGFTEVPENEYSVLQIIKTGWREDCKLREQIAKAAPPDASPGETADSLTAMDLRETLAMLCHEQWSEWMRYLFSKCLPSRDLDLETTAIIPHWALERWYRQMDTPYQELSEDEKGSDRDEADKILVLLSHTHTKGENGK